MPTILSVLALLLAAGLLWKLFELSKQNNDLKDVLQRVHSDIDQKLYQHSDQFERKIQATTTNLFSITKNLSDLQTSHRHIKELRDELTSLNTILHTPKLRGNLGELLLEDLLRNYFPSDRYQMQYEFPNGNKVDACIFLEDHFKLCIDAKFPLENYRKFIETQEDKHIKEFGRDVKKHIKDISSKYILPKERTLNFALMYIPSETIYYEILTQKELSPLFEQSFELGVIPISPSTFFSYVQILLLGFKGLQVEEHAERILIAVQDLGKNLEQFSGTYEKAEKHLSNASNAFTDAKYQLGKMRMITESLAEMEIEPQGTSIPVSHPKPSSKKKTEEVDFTVREIGVERS